jgi:hypothetical protein
VKYCLREQRWGWLNLARGGTDLMTPGNQKSKIKNQKSKI